MAKFSLIFGIIPSSLGAFWLYNNVYLPKYVGSEDLTGKVAVITGGSSGIGHELARRLALRNATLVLACKDMNKCHSVREEMSKITDNKNIFCSELNLESSESINNFVKRMSGKFQKIDILVNNAGFKGGTKLEITNEFIERNLAINAIGPHLLTKGLIPLLAASESARVLYLICSIYEHAKIFSDDVNFIQMSKNNFSGILAFGQSQSMKFLSMRYFADQYKSLKITFNACDPGFTNTNFYHNQSFHSFKIVKALKAFIYRDVSRAAETPEMCCVSEELNGITGMIYKNMKQVEYTPKILDPNLLKIAISVFDELTNDETGLPI